MSVSIKTAQEIELMRESGHLLEKVHDGLIPYIKPGMSTKEIDRIGEDMIRSMGCIPNFLNYGGFPGSFCINLYQITILDNFVLRRNSVDHFIIQADAEGEVSKEAKQLMDVTRQCFFEGIKFAKAGNHLNDISRQSERMRRNTVMVLYEIWWDMGLVLIFTKIRRFPTSLRNAGE